MYIEERTYKDWTLEQILVRIGELAKMKAAQENTTVKVVKERAILKLQ
jgi:hypothetical protein